MIGQWVIWSLVTSLSTLYIFWLFADIERLNLGLADKIAYSCTVILWVIMLIWTAITPSINKYNLLWLAPTTMLLARALAYYSGGSMWAMIVAGLLLLIAGEVWVLISLTP